MKPNEKTRKALTAWQKELEAILAPLIPTEPHPGIVLEPDFRRLVIPSPSPLIVDTAIDAVTDYAIRQELTARARRLEADLTNFDCNKRRFHEECKNMRVAHERQAKGTLSDAPEALKQLRRNLKGDIARLEEIISGTAATKQPPVEAVLVGEQAETLADIGHNAEIAAARTLKEQNAQTGTKQRRERAPGMNDKTVASMFNAKAQPLVRKVIKNNGDEKGEYTAAVKESRDKGEKGGMIDAYGGYCIYEPKRGGDRSGYATYGTLSVAGLRKWLKTYPNALNRNPYCGFHADMLADPAALETCADIWGKHCLEYARRFYEWRKIHRTAPRSQFRFNAIQKTVHGAEKMAATQ